MERDGGGVVLDLLAEGVCHPRDRLYVGT